MLLESNIADIKKFPFDGLHKSISISQLTGPALDWAVAHALKRRGFVKKNNGGEAIVYCYMPDGFDLIEKVFNPTKNMDDISYLISNHMTGYQQKQSGNHLIHVVSCGAYTCHGNTFLEAFCRAVACSISLSDTILAPHFFWAKYNLIESIEHELTTKENSECPYLIIFDDQDQKSLSFAGAGARAAADKTFDELSISWNVHLYVRVKNNSRDDTYPNAILANK